MARDLSENAFHAAPAVRAPAELRIQDIPTEIRGGAGADEDGESGIASRAHEASAEPDFPPAEIADAPVHDEEVMHDEDFAAREMSLADMRGEDLADTIPSQVARDVTNANASLSRSPAEPVDRTAFVARASLIVAVAAAILLAAFGLYLAERVKDLKNNAAQLQRQLSSMEHRIGRLELDQEQRRSPQLDDKGNAVSSDTNPVASRFPPPPEPGMTLSQVEIDTVREFIKVTPMAQPRSPSLNVGMSLAGQPAIPLPPQLIEKVPKLAGARFRVDLDGSVALVPRGSDRIGFIIPPR